MKEAAMHLLPARPSLDSLRKQAKKLARLAAVGDASAHARVRAELPHYAPPLSQRDAQLVIAREYGFPGWHALRAEVLARTGHGLDWAASEAERAIHDRDQDRLRALLVEHPALLQWRDDDGHTLLHAAVASFGDSGSPERERHYTRVAAAELLIDAGVTIDPALWRDVVASRGKGMLEMFARKHGLPDNLIVRACLGDMAAVRAQWDSPELEQALLRAARFREPEIAAFLLDRWIERYPALGARIDAGPGRAGLIAWLDAHAQDFGDPWRTYSITRLLQAVEDGASETFTALLDAAPELLGRDAVDAQVELIERATLHDRAAILEALFARDPAVLHAASPAAAMTFAVEYGHATLVPLLSRIWPLPDDLPHAAALGDLARVQRWFDAEGKPALGELMQHHPANNPHTRGNLRWGSATVQQVLDVALAWACMNRQFDVAEFLIAHGANVNTDWSTHEPASILHECAIRGNFAGARWLIDHGADLGRRDYRWYATPEGWAFHAAKDMEMAQLLRDAAEERT
jgi:hypothetical protein